MCGIVGLVSREPVSDREILITMRESLQHRGPDDAGAWWSPDGRVGLAQRRLAIIDLSPGGHQPMADAAHHLWITFNGEIYNYRELREELRDRGHHFRTASDTEVLLEAYRAWGVDCLAHLNGMFAFALYDSQRHWLFLARDRAGEKPLFYANYAGQFVFASELKALMALPAHPRKLDLCALDAYLAYGYVPGDMCMLKGVHKLAQGHAMTYELDTEALHLWQYWQLPTPLDQLDVPAEALVTELDTLLEDAVRRQLIADVPVGILLSGGLDSSLVTAMAARLSSKPVHTFTVSFPGHDMYDEGPYAKLVAAHFGTHHTELAAEAATVELLPTLARQYDEPIADSSIIPTYLVSRLIRQHATVALGGDGGDELFGGYPHYSLIAQVASVQRFVPRLLRKWIGMMAARMLPIGWPRRNHLIGCRAGLPYSIAHVNLYFDDWSRRRLLAPVIQERSWRSHAPETRRAALCVPTYTPIRQATEADFRTTLVDAFLVKVDRASMLNALEVRAPWLDYRLIEFAFGRVPDTLRATTTARKILPRRLAQRLLPPSFDVTRKQGFAPPLTDWFKGAWGVYMEEVLRATEPRLFNRQLIDKLLVQQRQGYDTMAHLFALTFFELWRREYRVTL